MFAEQVLQRGDARALRGASPARPPGPRLVDDQRVERVVEVLAGQDPRGPGQALAPRRRRGTRFLGCSRSTTTRLEPSRCIRPGTLTRKRLAA
jgi:hypothetical protein